VLVTSYTKRIDYYAFPRVGSHYLFHIFSGLYDLVLLDSEDFRTEEYLSRSNEIDEMSLYSLRLRDLNLPRSSPIYVNPNPNGIHGLAKDFGYPIICLTREPVAAIYSYYRMKRDRFQEKIEDLHLWIGEKLQEYEDFYKAALSVGAKNSENFLLLRYEDVCSSPEYLQEICDFIGESPKLSPEFVHHVTSFSNFIKGENRTFYREGDNAKWRDDSDFVTNLSRHDYPVLPELGYPPLTI
jgi:hypothetical protein